MTNSAQKLIDRLKAQGIQPEHQPTADGGDMIAVAFAGAEQEVSYELLTIIDASESSIILRCFDIFPVKPEQETDALRALNLLNMNFRWVKFYLDEENQVAAGADAVATPDCAGDVAFELLGRSLHIINAGYQQVKSALS